jgi:ABC-type Zn2+ transport system substrate-binding protein/surface adhesin
LIASKNVDLQSIDDDGDEEEEPEEEEQDDDDDDDDDDEDDDDDACEQPKERRCMSRTFVFHMTMISYLTASTIVEEFGVWMPLFVFPVKDAHQFPQVVVVDCEAN